MTDDVQNHGRHRRLAALPGGVAMLVSALLSTLYSGAVTAIAASTSAASSTTSAAAPISVTTVKVVQENVAQFLAGVGTVQANASVTIKSRVDGQLEKVGFIEGQDVKAGQMIAQLDRRPFLAQLAQCEAQKARDLAQLANARLDLQRYLVLIADDGVTQQTLATQKAQVLGLEAAVKTDEAQCNFAKIQLDYTTITAPLSGRIGARLVDPGNIVHASDTLGLAVINQIDPIAIVFTLPEDAFPDILRALKNTASPPAVLAYGRTSEHVLAQGALVLLNNQIDSTSGTVALKGRFRNPAQALWPGQYVRLRLVLGHNTALTIPAQALQRSQSGTYVYLVKTDNTVQIQPVEIKRIQDAKAIIEQGLKAGDRVVQDGQFKLQPGAHVIEASAAK